MQLYYGYQLLYANQFGRDFVIDCEFAENLNPKAYQLFLKTVSSIMKINRESMEPLKLWFCEYNAYITATSFDLFIPCKFI